MTSFVDSIMRTHGRTEYGQEILPDYGLDDLNAYRDDLDTPQVVEHTIAHKREVVATIAVLDEDMPAVVVRRDAERTRVRRKMTDPEVTRDPDFLDDREVGWLTDFGVVVVPLERADDFYAWVSSRGLAPCGRGAYELTALTNDCPASAWEAVQAIVTA